MYDRQPSLTAVSFKLLFFGVFAIIGVAIIRNFSGMLGIPEISLSYWMGAVAYLWVNATTLVIGWRVFWRATEALNRAAVRKEKAKDKEQTRQIEAAIKKIETFKKRGLQIAILFHAASAALIWFGSQYVTDNMTWRLVAVAISIAIAGIKPLYIFAESAMRTITDLDRETQYPEKTVQDLIDQLEDLKALEERCEAQQTQIEELLREQADQFEKDQEKRNADHEASKNAYEKQLASMQLEQQKTRKVIDKFAQLVHQKLDKLGGSDAKVMAALRTILMSDEARALLGIQSDSNNIEKALERAEEATKQS